MRTARELAPAHDREPVEVAGLVIVRQRPETAQGILFVSLEDETGIANLVVMPDIYERYRALVRGSPFLLVAGTDGAERAGGQRPGRLLRAARPRAARRGTVA